MRLLAIAAAIGSPARLALQPASDTINRQFRRDTTLAIIGHDQIGRLTIPDPATPAARRPGAGVGLNELLRAQASDGLFDYLPDTCLAAGISGVQPKVLMPDADAGGVAGTMHTTARLSDLIVKASSLAYPDLTQNEFLCMDATWRASIDVPEFHLSDDGSLFVIRRFDRTATGERLGFEDVFTVQTGVAQVPIRDGMQGAVRSQ